MNRHKDRDPRETVERIKGILDELDVHPQGEVSDFAGRFYSLRISDAPTHTGTNGKGATADLARASAFGEYMERLENGMIVSPFFSADEADALEGLAFWPDGHTVSFDEMCGRYPEIVQELAYNYMPQDILEPDAACKDLDEVLSFWRDNLPGPMTLLPYYCVGSRSCVELPDSLFPFHCSSNGLCSGNTPAEALVEGMSELCERYSKACILHKALCPPRIPREFIEEHCPVQAEMLRAIKAENPHLNIIVADASLGQGLPVVCMLFIDQQRGAIRSKFGAHPSMAIAMERCMTEHYQGYGSTDGIVSARDQHARHFATWDSWSRATVHSLTMSGPMASSDTGVVPNRLLLHEPDWGFEPWGLDDGFTNRQAVRRLAALLRKTGGEVYIRDNGFLGVPAYRIYVPHVSHVLSSIGPHLLDSRKYGVQLGCALSAYEQGDCRLAADFLKLSGTREDLCAAQELLCREEGIPEEQRDILLEEYFGKGAAAYARAIWRADDARAALHGFNHRKNLFKTLGATQHTKDTAQMDARAALARRLKERKVANPIDQMRLDELFSPGI